ncbi:MAG TPA: hypothetical protein VFK32_07595, partial [Tepidiformaceae bacterium]|nr:hypothetical protein [Tepidiformaceae bacterium]
EIAIERTIALQAAEAGGGPTTFTGTLDLDRSGRAGYAVSVLPNHPMLRDPLSLGLVRWSQPLS